MHPDCILAVFAADTPLPTPSRLEWLTTCGELDALFLLLAFCRATHAVCEALVAAPSLLAVVT